MDRLYAPAGRRILTLSVGEYSVLMTDATFDLSTVFSTVATAIPEQTVLIWRDRPMS